MKKGIFCAVGIVLAAAVIYAVLRHNMNSSDSADNARDAYTESAADTSSAEETVEIDTSKMSREELQEYFDIYGAAKQYYMDPEELTDAFVRGVHGDRFSPFSETRSYSPEEWEALMTERYGDAWKDW